MRLVLFLESKSDRPVAQVESSKPESNRQSVPRSRLSSLYFHSVPSMVRRQSSYSSGTCPPPARELPGQSRTVGAVVSDVTVTMTEALSTLLRLLLMWTKYAPASADWALGIL